MKRKKKDYISLLKEELSITNELVIKLENYNIEIKKGCIISFIEKTKIQYDNINKTIFDTLIEEFITKFNREDIYAVSKKIIDINNSLYILFKLFDCYKINYLDFTQSKLIHNFKTIINYFYLVVSNLDKIDLVLKLLIKLEQELNISIEDYFLVIKKIDKTQLELNTKIQYFIIFNIYRKVYENMRELKYSIEQLIIKNI